MKRVGLIVNPIAGLGGRVGLKGSDGQVLQALALARGAEPRAAQRARLAIETLLAECDDVAMIAAPGAMGADALNGLPISVQVLPLDIHQPSTAEDTMRIARAMCDIPVDLLLFAGGDGTARDIYHAVGSSPPVLGIPAGVKIQSGVFAVTPLAAGEIAACFLSSSKPLTSDAEVADLDEETYISGEMNSRLFGVLRVPYLPNRRQNRKAPTPEAEAVRAQGIAADVAEKIQRGWLTILGPGMTTRAIALHMGWPKTLLGVDVYADGHGQVVLDADETGLLRVLRHAPARLVLSPTGGQGFLLGRGNQQLSPAVLRWIGRQNLVVVSLIEKLIALKGEPLRLDTGDLETDRWLAGYKRVTTGYHQSMMYKVE